MLQLLRDNIAVIPMEDPDKVGSIYIPEKAKQMPDQGIVIRRAPGTKLLRVGDHVFFSPYSGTKVTIEGEGTLIILSEDDVFFVDTAEHADGLVLRSRVITALERAESHLHQTHPDDRERTTEVVSRVVELLNAYLAEGLEF